MLPSSNTSTRSARTGLLDTLLNWLEARLRARRRSPAPTAREILTEATRLAGEDEDERFVRFFVDNGYRLMAEFRLRGAPLDRPSPGMVFIPLHIYVRVVEVMDRMEFADSEN